MFTYIHGSKWANPSLRQVLVWSFCKSLSLVWPVHLGPVSKWHVALIFRVCHNKTPWAAYFKQQMYSFRILEAEIPDLGISGSVSSETSIPDCGWLASHVQGQDTNGKLSMVSSKPREGGAGKLCHRVERWEGGGKWSLTWEDAHGSHTVTMGADIWSEGARVRHGLLLALALNPHSKFPSWLLVSWCHVGQFWSLSFTSKQPKHHLFNNRN